MSPLGWPNIRYGTTEITKAWELESYEKVRYEKNKNTSRGKGWTEQEGLFVLSGKETF